MAILENAHSVSEDQRINAVWYLSFSLPYDDPKNQYCQPFCYVRHDGGELYRIMPAAMTVDETGSVAYQCEHVLATLIDNVLFGYHVVGNLGTYTPEVIQYVLDHQLTRNWVLDQCDYRNQFEYGWEQESLLSALFSVATPLVGPYIWRTDTSVYPWRLSLKRLDTAVRPEMYVRRRHNMTSYQRQSDPQNIVTRLYPLGYGEGVNQLGIAGVNGGVPYLQSPKSVTDKYGIIERVWTDRRYEDPASLKSAAAAMLEALQEPAVSYSIGYQEIGASDFDQAAIGKRLRIVYPEIGESVDTYITGISRNYSDIQQSAITVANKETSIASSLADMADRQRIEQTYAQGATQVYSQALQANCDADSGAVMDFFIPAEMRIINKVLVKVRVDRFRAYSQSTAAGGASVATSTSSEEHTWTSQSGGRATATSSGGGGQTTSSGGGDTSSAVTLENSNTVTDYSDDGGAGGANHNHALRRGDMIALTDGTKITGFRHFVPSGKHIHPAHSHTMPSHTHTVRNHTHNVDIPDHTHDIKIPGHRHNVDLPSHAHEITPGIYRFGNPQSFGLYINRAKKAEFSGRTAELDITDLLTGADNMIPRGSWLSLEVRPDDLAYISIDLMVQGFVQSRGDKTV